MTRRNSELKTPNSERQKQKLDPQVWWLNKGKGNGKGSGESLSPDNARVSEAKGRKHRSDRALRPRAPQS